MWAKALTAALAVLTAVCSTSWAEGSPQGDSDRILAGSQALALNLNFHTLVPCRAVDTRAGVPLTSGTPRTFQIAGGCGVPGTAKALTVNVTVAGPTGQGFLNLWPANLPEPPTSMINFGTAMTRANNAMVTLATDGSGGLSAKASLADSGSVHLIIDVTGYMAGDPLPQCQCPIDGVPFMVIFGANPISVVAGSWATITGKNFPTDVQVLFGDPATGSAAPIASHTSMSITLSVPPPPPSFTFSAEPCDVNSDGIIDGTRNIPTPISVHAQSLDGTGCVAMLINAFTLFPDDMACTPGGGNPAGPPNGFGTAAMPRANHAMAPLAGDPVTQCLCPTNGTPLPQLLGISPSSGAVNSTVTVSGQNFAPASRVQFGDPVTGSSAAILSSSSTSITARVPTPPFDFEFSTEPCDGNGDGIIGGTRLIPTPMTVSVRSLDDTGCVSTLSNAFTLNPPITICIGDNSTPPAPR